jgi:iron complex outermembrane receptor protein
LKKHIALSAALGFSFGNPGLAADAGSQKEAIAETSLEEIVVTAERRETSLLKAPLAVTALDGAEIQKSGAATFQQVLQNVPGLILQKPDDTEQGGPPVIAIRGLGADSTGTQPATAIYEDGVLVTASNAFFYDLSRVEVLRGPQGTLYGQGATGGAVNVIHNEPKMNSGVDAQVEVGNHSLIHTTFAGNMAASDTLAFRIAANQLKHDGYNSHGYGGADLINARLTALYKPSERFSLLVGGGYYYSTNQGEIETPVDSADGSIADDFFQPDPKGGKKSNQYHRFFANLHWDVGPFQLTYIPGYQTNTMTVNAYGGPGIQVGGKSDTTHTQELRISNAQDSWLTWVAGAYYLRNNNHNIFHGGFPIDYATALYTPLLINVDQTEKRDGLAFFGEFTAPLGDRLRLTGGIRHQHTSISYQEEDVVFGAPSSFDVRPKYNHVDYRARLEGDVGQSGLAYGSVSTGARPGGVGANGTEFGPEKVTAYEAGYKSRLADGRLQLALAGYYYDYGGFQSPVPIVDPNNTAAIIGWSVSIIPAKFYGAELELTAKLTPDDVLTFTPAWEHGEYTANYTISPQGPPGAPPALVSVLSNGKAPPHVPEWSLAASFEHTFRLANGGNIAVSVSGKYQGEQYNGLDATVYGTAIDPPGTVVPNPSYVTGSYTLLDAQLGYTAPGNRYSISVFGRNLTDEHYKLNAIPGAAPGGLVARVNDPRTFGIIAAVHF